MNMMKEIILYGSGLGCCVHFPLGFFAIYVILADLNKKGQLQSWDPAIAIHGLLMFVNRHMPQENRT